MIACKVLEFIYIFLLYGALMVHISIDRMLTEEQVSFYKTNGFIILDDIFSARELEECSREYDNLFERKRASDLEATWGGDWNQKANAEQPTSVCDWKTCTCILILL